MPQSGQPASPRPLLRSSDQRSRVLVDGYFNALVAGASLAYGPLSTGALSLLAAAADTFELSLAAPTPTVAKRCLNASLDGARRAFQVASAERTR